MPLTKKDVELMLNSLNKLDYSDVLAVRISRLVELRKELLDKFGHSWNCTKIKGKVICDNCRLVNDVFPDEVLK